ncbi:hypothetical protein ECEC1856_2852, partial [Escherichia coli EC1856]
MPWHHARPAEPA